MNFFQNLYYNATHSGIGIFLGWWIIACMIAIPLILVYGRKIFLTRDETVMRCILIPIFCAIGALLISTTFIEYPANGKALWVKEKDGEWRRYDRPVLHAPFSWTGWDESSREITVEAPNSFNYGKLPVRRGLTVTVTNNPEDQKLFF